MDINNMLGSCTGDVSRGVLRARPRRVYKKLGALGLIVALGATGLADATYKVTSGDNLTKIARSRGVSVKAIAAANGIKNLNLIRTGRILRIPGATPVAAKTPGPGVARETTGTLVRHRVALGENLTSIAAKYRTSVATLVSINGIRNPSLVRAGQLLRVPGPAAVKAAAAAARPAPQAPPPPVAVVAPSLPVPALPANLPPKPPTSAISSSKPPGVEDLIELFSQKYGVQPALLKGLAWQESGWKQHVVSPAGAIGIMQVMPQTGEFVSRHLLKRPVDLNDSRQNVEAGIAFFAFYLSKTSGDERTAVAGYFQGLRSVWQNGVSERTQRYVSAVFALRGRFAA